MIENGQHMSVVATDGCASKTEAEISQVFKEMTPKRYRFLRDASGIDAANQRLEVVPASHYQFGGIYINERGESSVKGLYAGGEVAGNFQGASRLAGSALCDTQTMGARIGGCAADDAGRSDLIRLKKVQWINKSIS
jgi:aspartate oxidase